MFAGLQDLGVANGEDLKETLTNCTEPLKAIEQFQVGRGAEAGPLGRESGRGRGRVGSGHVCLPPNAASLPRDGGAGCPDFVPH